MPIDPEKALAAVFESSESSYGADDVISELTIRG